MNNNDENYEKLVKQIGTLKFVILIMAVALIFDSAKRIGLFGDYNITANSVSANTILLKGKDNKSYGKLTGLRMDLLRQKKFLKIVYGYIKENYPDIRAVGWDPGHPSFKERQPGPFDMLISTDVLEHIEPVFLDNVLKDINETFSKIAFLIIATSPAKAPFSIITISVLPPINLVIAAPVKVPAAPAK